MADPYDSEGIEAPPEFERPWLRSERLLPRRVARPVELFIRTEVGGGLVLLAAAIAALVWANASSGSYEEFWSAEVALSLGPLELSEDLRQLVNELLMAIFFFVVGLEVKREFVHGELRDPRSAGAPVAAAIGGMIVPALIFVGVNLRGGELDGWAIPVATDIAFALAVLALLMPRGPLRAFLLTLAIIDDVGTILIIAVFFSDSLSVAWLAVAAATVGVFLGLQRMRVRLLTPYVIAAGVLWLAVFEGGIHATIAGVVLGLLTPATAFHRREATADAITDQLAEIRRSADAELSEETMREVSILAEEAASPLVRMEGQVHPWSSYAVLPIFALANAGVELSGSALADVFTTKLGLGILFGLVIGKPVGTIALTAAATKLTPARLPDGIGVRHIAAIGPLAGIGFSVAIFISGLAFTDPALLDQAKVAILVASVIAGTIGTLLLAFVKRREE